MSQQLIGQGVVEIVADASGVSGIIAAAAREAERGGAAIGKAVGDGAAKAGDGIELLDGKVRRYVASVDREIAAISLSRTEYRAWEAQVKGISESVYVPLIARMNEAREAEGRLKAENALQEKIQQAAGLVKASEYVRFWEDSLEKAAAKERAFAETAAFDQKSADAAKLVRAGAYVSMWEDLLEKAAAGERAFSDTEAFNQKTADAAKLVKASEYVRFWEDALQDADRAQSKLASNNAFVQGLEKQAGAIGKTRADLLEMEAAQRGVAAAAAPHIAALRAQETATLGVARATNAAGMSQKAYDAALRGVPAQITDIVVSLQGGQAPLTVLLQQGGQLKDMFNGVVPAIRALGNELLKLALNPYVAVAAAIVALGAAYYKGAQENDAYVKSLAMTGNRAGVTAAQLNVAAEAMSQLGGSQSEAAAALATLIDAGGVTGLQDLTRYGNTARDAQKYLGLEVKETAKAFADLAKDPLKATERLTEQMGYLTHAQYQQIKALIDAGDKTAAATLAQQLYDRAVADATNAVVKNLGYIERGWNAIVKEMKDAVSWAAKIGRPDDQKTMAGMERTLGLAKQQELITKDPTERLKIEEAIRAENLRMLKESDRALTKAEDQRTQDEKIAAQKRLDEQKKAARSRAEIRKDELDQLGRDAVLLKLTQKDVAEREKAINEKYKDKAERKPKAFQDDYATKTMLQLREQESALRAQLEVQEKLTDAQRAAAKFESEVAEAKAKKGTLTAEQKSLLANEATVRAQHAINVGLAEQGRAKEALAKQDKEAQDAIDAYELSIKRLTATMDSNAASRADALDRMRNGAGRGDRDSERSEEERKLMREFERNRASANRAGITKGGTGADPADIAAINAKQAEALQLLRDYYATEDSLRKDWRNGYTKAFSDYYDSAQDVAGRVGNAITRGLNAVEDAFVSLATTGKISFSGLANSIVADLVRIQARAAMAQAAGGSGGGLLSSLFGAAFSYFTGGTSAAVGGGTGAGSVMGDLGSYGAFSGGGYTGPGGKYDYAGAVHKGEVVWSQDDVQAHGGADVVDNWRRRRSYANGGKVGGGSTSSMGGGFDRVIMHNYGVEAEAKTQTNESGGLDLVVIARQVGQVLGNDLAQGVGPIARGGENRYGWKRGGGR